MESALQLIPRSKIAAEPQIRTRNGFDAESITGLAESIKTNGLLQPIVVRQFDADTFIVVAGHRRLAALDKLRTDTVPCLLTAINGPQDATAPQLIENLQRVDLCLADLVAGVRALAEQSNAEELPKLLGKSKSWVSKHLSVTGPAFSPKALELIQSGKVTDLEIAHAYNQIAKAKGHDDAKGLVLMKFDTAIDFETITRQGAIALLDEFKRRCKPVQNEISYDAPEGDEAEADATTNSEDTTTAYTIKLTGAQAQAFIDKGGIDWLLAELGA